MSKYRWTLTLFACGWLCACATTITLPAHLQRLDPAQLRQSMASAKTSLTCYEAEVRLQYFGPKGRYKGTATLWAQKPAMFRYDVEGPHGGVAVAFATDGNIMQVLDMGKNQFTEGPAAAQNFDKLLPLAPLGLNGTAWTNLFFGEVDVPPEATLSFDDSQGAYHWHWLQPPHDISVFISPKDNRVRGITVRNGDATVSAVKVVSRAENGLPSTLSLDAPLAQVQVLLRLRDVQTPASIGHEMFSLPHPRGLQTQPIAP